MLLQTGKTLWIEFTNGLFRTTIDGRRFCATSEKELRQAVSSISPVVDPTHSEPAVVKPVVRNKTLPVSKMASAVAAKSKSSFYDIDPADIMFHERDITRRSILLTELAELEKC